MTMLYIYLVGGPHFGDDLSKRARRFVAAVTGEARKIKVFKPLLKRLILLYRQQHRHLASLGIGNELNILNHDRRLIRAPLPLAAGS